MSERTVLIDASVAGASGDMFLSALIDLTGEDDALLPVAAALLIYDPTLRVKVIEQTKDDASGKKLEVTRDKGIRLSPSSMKEVLGTIAEELELSRTAQKKAEQALDELLQAEVRAHDTPLEKLHLHETGSVDTILDIVGTFYLLEKSQLLTDTSFLGTRVAVGSGTIQTEHGELEVPVPAVAEILVAHDVPFHTGDAKTEVLTPTGAALLVTLVDEWVEGSEGFTTRNQGIGFGTRELRTVPNLLRLMVGERAEPEAVREEAVHTKVGVTSEIVRPEEKPVAERIQVFNQWEEDEVVVVEANVDDVDGEVLGSLFDMLLTDGLAYDVVMIPAYGKKNRPCFIVKAITPMTMLKSVAEIMIKHLGTIGIRYASWQRLKAPRETIVCRLEIDDKDYMVRVKVSRDNAGAIVSIKPEADDMIAVSKETGIPMRELKPRVSLQAHAVTD